MRIYCFLIVALMCGYTVIGQTNAEEYQLRIKRATDPIKLDGIIDEKSWDEAHVAASFWQREPLDGVKAHINTEGRVTYDDNFLYVAITCYDLDDDYIVKTLRRDESLWGNDGAGVIIDPFGERTNGYLFGTNTTGAQTDVQLGGSTGEENYKKEWNSKWYSETHINVGENSWSLEMAIPFKTLRYSPDNKRWLINFVRSDASHNQSHVWAPVPRQFWAIDLGYAGSLHWDEAPPATKSNIAVIPYVSAGVSEDFTNKEGIDKDVSTGLDAKIAITPSLNLDLTVNPDFSQVEVDQQVTNLTRFSIFFPERRNFFLENSDIFSGFGSPLLRPFFSRRIGLGQGGTPVPIYAGARLSGNLNDNLRIGLLDVHTGSSDDINAQNYFTAAASHRVLKRSKVSAFFTNRQGFDGVESIDGDYGRNAGVEMDYKSENGEWSAWGAYHHSFKPNITDKNGHFRGGFQHSGKVLKATFAFGHVGTNFYADIGFVNRIIQYNAETKERIRQGFNYLFFPVEVKFIPEEQNLVQTYKFGLRNFINYNDIYERTEANHSISGEIEFTNSSKINANVNRSNVILQYPFAFIDAKPLPAGEYTYTNYELRYDSDNRKVFSYKVGLNAGGFYNGTRLQTTAELNYRRQPWGQFSLTGEFNKLEFPEGFGKRDIWLVGTKAEISFSRDLFWFTFLQYNTQANNFNVNSRFQWQFKPLSWVYLVYTDNYITPVWDKKHRSLVFKVNYWLNL